MFRRVSAWGLFALLLGVGGCDTFDESVVDRSSDSRAEYYWNLYAAQSSNVRTDADIGVVVIDKNYLPVANAIVYVGDRLTQHYHAGSTTDSHGVYAYKPEQSVRPARVVTVHLSGASSTLVTAIDAPLGPWLFQFDHGASEPLARWPQGVFAKVELLGGRKCTDVRFKASGVPAGFSAVFDVGLSGDDRWLDANLPGEICPAELPNDGRYAVVASAIRVAPPNDMTASAFLIHQRNDLDHEFSLAPVATTFTWSTAEEPLNSVQLMGAIDNRWYRVANWSQQDAQLNDTIRAIMDFPATQYNVVAQATQPDGSKTVDVVQAWDPAANSGVVGEHLHYFVGEGIDMPNFHIPSAEITASADELTLRWQITGTTPDALLLRMTRDVVGENRRVDWLVYIPPDVGELWLPGMKEFFSVVVNGQLIDTDIATLDGAPFVPLSATLEAIDAEDIHGYSEYMARLHADGLIDDPTEHYRRVRVPVVMK
jgi:hypothetical protein